MFGFEPTANVNNGVQTPEQGASTQVWAAVHPDAAISGQYAEGNKHNTTPLNTRRHRIIISSCSQSVSQSISQSVCHSFIHSFIH
jgi:hypothetical protein